MEGFMNAKHSYRCFVRLMFIALLGLPMAIAPVLVNDPAGYAFADDDDDDDDDDNGGGGGGGSSGGTSFSGSSSGGSSGSSRRSGSSGKTLFDALKQRLNPRKSAPRRSRPAARRAAPPPAIYADREVIALGLSQEDIEALVDDGFAVLEQIDLLSLTATLYRLRIPAEQSLDAARDTVRALRPDALLDLNHHYRPSSRGGADGAGLIGCEGPHCPDRALVGWVEPGGQDPACARPVRVGIVDTGINPEHTTFEGGEIEFVQMEVSGGFDSGRQHGTAVAAILIGSGESRSPGLLSGAKLVAADPFYRKAGDERADAYHLIAAIDAVVDQEVAVLNLSLAGAANEVVERIVNEAAQKGVVVVASAGNNGPRAKPVYPAAYDTVIAVTAVDRAKRVYRRAGQGDHIDFAAPGVQVWTAASVSGARPKTGTSFAAPFVTAAAAMLKRQDQSLDHRAVKAILAETALDLGAEGRDPVFGHGLLQASGLCPAALPGE